MAAKGEAVAGWHVGCHRRGDAGYGGVSGTPIWLLRSKPSSTWLHELERVRVSKWSSAREVRLLAALCTARPFATTGGASSPPQHRCCSRPAIYDTQCEPALPRTPQLRRHPSRAFCSRSGLRCCGTARPLYPSKTITTRPPLHEHLEYPLKRW